jgi:hypothetical protein
MGRILLGGLSGEELDNILRKSDLKAITPYTVIDPAQLKQIIRDDCAKGWSLVNQELEEAWSRSRCRSGSHRTHRRGNERERQPRALPRMKWSGYLAPLQRTALQIGDALKMRAA